jgi:hypothetical protein
LFEAKEKEDWIMTLITWNLYFALNISFVVLWYLCMNCGKIKPLVRILDIFCRRFDAFMSVINDNFTRSLRVSYSSSFPFVFLCIYLLMPGPYGVSFWRGVDTMYFKQSSLKKLISRNRSLCIWCQIVVSNMMTV